MDSNPYGLAIGSDGLLVTDAAGNTLLRVDANGEVSLVAVIPRIRGVKGRRKAPEPVPTSVAIGPDGAYYVGQFGGGGTPDGKASVIRVTPDGRPSVYASGFTAITGVAFDLEGNLYVSELVKSGRQFETGDFTGALIRVRPGGKRKELAKGKLQAPSGVAIGSDGTIYVSVNGVFPGRGKVLSLSSS